MKTEELILREVTEADLPVFFEHQRNPEAFRLVGSTPRDLAAYTEHWAEVEANREVLRRTVEVGGEAAGYVASFLREEVREVGYWMGRAHWGRGLATRALRAFLELEGRRPLIGRTAKHNLASLRVLEKCGFLRIDEEEFKSRAGEVFAGWILELPETG